MTRHRHPAPLYAQDADYRRWLHSPRWQSLRLKRIAEHPFCEHCQRERRLSAATEVHHVRPVLAAPTRTERERRMFDEGNLVALCHDCHVAEHRRLGKQTRDDRRRREHDRVEAFMGRYFGTSPNENKPT